MDRTSGLACKAVTCPAINGIIEEANELAGDIADKEVLDAALLACAQAVEHYEITRYGALIAWAGQIGRNDFADVLEANLKEEKSADEKLSTLAKSRVNAQAGGRQGTSRKAPAARRKGGTRNSRSKAA